MVLVGNKCDLVEQRAVSRKAGEDLCKKFNCKFLEASARTRENIDEVHIYIYIYQKRCVNSLFLTPHHIRFSSRSFVRSILLVGRTLKRRRRKAEHVYFCNFDLPCLLFIICIHHILLQFVLFPPFLCFLCLPYLRVDFIMFCYLYVFCWKQRKNKKPCIQTKSLVLSFCPFTNARVNGAFFRFSFTYLVTLSGGNRWQRHSAVLDGFDNSIHPFVRTPSSRLLYAFPS